MDLTATYLGLNLAHPFMVGASPLADHLDTIKRLEDGGASAIVLRSLFEEQITMAESGTIHHMDPFDRQFSDALAGFPAPERYAFTPDAYLDHVRRAKSAVRVPVIASLNGMTKESWLTFANQLEQAGADALELNMYELATDATESSASVETRIRNTVVELKRHLRIPLAVKLLPFFTAFGHFARQLDVAHVDGVILFNRFYEPDIDIRSIAYLPRVELSTSAELSLRLHWAANLHRQLRCSIAITGGVARPTDGVKAVLAGAHAVQLVSAVLRHGAGYFRVMRDGLAQWMEAHEFMSLEQVRGRIDGSDASDLTERGNYIRTLQSWTS
jgi:dihydroorotate dehydrogenase (fumarate)